MASIVVKTKGGTTVSFANTPQAMNDLFLSSTTGLTEDALTTVKLDVMGNDLGGNAKTLWSLDDGTSGQIANPNGTSSPSDLLIQDAVGQTQYSSWGAQISISSDGQVSYNADSLPADVKAQLQGLGAGEYAEDTFTYAIRLGNGTLSWATATVRIDGVNDPVIIKNADLQGNVTETTGTPASGATLDDTGIITFKDADYTDTHSVSNGTFNAGSSSVASALGTLTANLDSDTTLGDGGQVTWSYSVDAASVEYLAAGEHRLEAFDIVISDGHGGNVTETIVVDIVGTEDAPVISIVGSDSDATTLDETDSGLAANGTLTVNDVDTSNSVTATVTGVVLGGDFGSLVSGDVDGMLSVTNTAINADTGDANNLAWSFDSGTQAFDFLQADESMTLTFAVKVDDGSIGGTDTHDVTITIDGTNDEAVIADVGSPDTSVTEDSDLVAGGTLSVTDLDHDEDHFVAASPADLAGDYGTFTFNENTGAWTYLLDNSNPAVQALNDDSTPLSDTLTVHSADGTSHDVIVTINGADEEPTVVHNSGSQDINLQFAAPQEGTSHADPTFTIQLPDGFDFSGTADLTVTGDIDQSSEHVFLTFEGGSQVNISGVGGGGIGEPDNVSTSVLDVAFSSADSTLTLSYHTSGPVGGNVQIVGTLDYTYDTLV